MHNCIQSVNAVNFCEMESEKEIVIFSEFLFLKVPFWPSKKNAVPLFLSEKFSNYDFMFLQMRPINFRHTI
jgi:hypothetical protein